jgi:hypothetical protein
VVVCSRRVGGDRAKKVDLGVIGTRFGVVVGDPLVPVGEGVIRLRTIEVLEPRNRVNEDRGHVLLLELEILPDDFDQLKSRLNLINLLHEKLMLNIAVRVHCVGLVRFQSFFQVCETRREG